MILRSGRVGPPDTGDVAPGRGRVGLTLTHEQRAARVALERSRPGAHDTVLRGRGQYAVFRAMRPGPLGDEVAEG